MAEEKKPGLLKRIFSFGFGKKKKAEAEAEAEAAQQAEAEAARLAEEQAEIARREAAEKEAEAQREAEILRGEGEGERNRVFAEAYTKDAEFFAFYRSMLAYKTALENSDTTVVLSPNSEFFNFFQDAGGQPAPKTGTPTGN